MAKRTNSNDCWMFEHDLSGPIADILRRAVDPIHGSDFKSEWLQRNIMSKFSDPSPKSQRDREKRAIEKLLNQERINAETNLRLRYDTRKLCVSGVGVETLLHTAKTFIGTWLGDLRSWDWLTSSQFSSGASTTRKRKSAFLHKKHDNRSSASAQVIRMFESEDYENSPVLHLIAQFQGIAEDGLKPVCHDYNELFTVPKNNEIDRCAAKEPDWNMFLQKGLGTLIRERLRAIGINLNDQSINNGLARVGSIDGSLATIDLSAASDSITSELVYKLLPNDWFEALDAVRSRVCKIPNTKRFHKWNLFSTMGNGFTFELESLIFYALLRACTYHFGIKGRTSVYGDDIICPVAVVPHLTSLFAVCGFVVNAEKSFSTGHFRESCGGHYYRGQNVTPIYIREPVTNIPALINIINQFRVWSCNNPCRLGSTENFQLWKELTLLVPKELRKAVIGGNDPFQRSYISAKIPFRGGLFEASKTRMCRGKDEEAAYNSWSWHAAVRTDIDTAWTQLPVSLPDRGFDWLQSPERDSYEFGMFSRYSTPVIVDKEILFHLKSKADLDLANNADGKRYKFSVIRDRGFNYRYQESYSELAFLFVDELIGAS